MSRPFVVFALPRSRTAWLAHWLSLQQDVGHDISILCDSPEDFFRQFAEGKMRGCVETAAIDAWRLIRARMPEARFVTIRRPLGAVRVSLLKFGLDPGPELELRDSML